MTGVRVDEAFRCEQCGATWYYDKHHCPVCASHEYGTTELDRGEVLSRTTVEMTPPDVRSPNDLALVRFGDVQLIAQLADDGVSTGDTVEFAGEYRLREGDDKTRPRLRKVTQ
ncbi:hypothetical protein GRX03_15240 [Halovenus sp. WSH3]|uniref:DUF35 domain-containing protein n=1 Tax=Halovenus carboxidivorans TaxID=2692199 RepID=A0A6B0TBE7_9EURY|nr:hypothetical protein [Halovenus carboxidivorans]MXR52953.1 hypothetical protein [Halovenus carboxidivorans]